MILANVFYRLKLFESYGTGISRILECYKGYSQPQFLIQSSSFVTILPNVHNSVKEEKKSIHLSTDEEIVLNIFQNQTHISRKDIQKIIGCSEFPARKIIKSLLEQDKMSVIGKGKATKYILRKKS